MLARAHKLKNPFTGLLLRELEGTGYHTSGDNDGYNVWEDMQYLFIHNGFFI